MEYASKKDIVILWNVIRSIKKDIIDLKIENQKLALKIEEISTSIYFDENISYDSDDSFYENNCKKYLEKKSLSKEKKKYFDIDAGKYV
jgi:malate synthase